VTPVRAIRLGVGRVSIGATAGFLEPPRSGEVFAIDAREFIPSRRTSMRFATRAGLVPFALMFVTLTALMALTACSDGASTPAKQTYVPPDAAVTVPKENPPLPPILIVVKGNGEVATSDGEIDCKSDSKAADCTPTHYGATLYAAGTLPWMFDHWEPSMSTDSSLYLASWTGGPITAVFVPIPGLDGGPRSK
jgi:hypothetical protein